MAAEEQTRLAAELDFYAAHKAEWSQEHSEKYVVVQDRNVLGFYPSFEDAFRAGVGAFGVTRDFLVKQILEHGSERPNARRQFASGAASGTAQVICG